MLRVKRIGAGQKQWVRIQATLFPVITTLLVALGWQFYLHPRFILRAFSRKPIEAVSEGLALTLRYALWTAFITNRWGLAASAGLYLAYNWVAANYIFINFAVSHTHLPVVPKEDVSVDWVRYAAVHTMNVSPGPLKFVSWWMSYLNFQVRDLSSFFVRLLPLLGFFLLLQIFFFFSFVDKSTHPLYSLSLSRSHFLSRSLPPSPRMTTDRAPPVPLDAPVPPPHHLAQGQGEDKAPALALFPSAALRRPSASCLPPVVCLSAPAALSSYTLTPLLSLSSPSPLLSSVTPSPPSLLPSHPIRPSRPTTVPLLQTTQRSPSKTRLPPISNYHQALLEKHGLPYDQRDYVTAMQVSREGGEGEFRILFYLICFCLTPSSPPFTPPPIPKSKTECPSRLPSPTYTRWVTTSFTARG